MAGRTRAVRNTPINSVNSINSVDSQQPQCEDADMEGTPIHMPQQELSPPYTRDSTHRHDPETHGNDIRMPDTTFTPMFQIPDPAYGMPDSTFSAGLLDPDALPKLMKLLTELKNSFFLNCASETYSLMVNSLDTEEGRNSLLCYWATFFQSDLRKRNASQARTEHVGNEGNHGLS